MPETFWLRKETKVEASIDEGYCITKWSGVEPNAILHLVACSLGSCLDRVVIAPSLSKQTVVATRGDIPTCRLDVDVDGLGGKVAFAYDDWWEEDANGATMPAAHHEINHYKGCKVFLTALPDKGYGVKEWIGGGLTGQSRFQEIPMDQDKQIQVRFESTDPNTTTPDPNTTPTDPNTSSPGPNTTDPAPNTGSNGGSGQQTEGTCPSSAAVAGSYLEADLDVLRAFRDEVLMATAPGRWLVENYYAHGPPIAAAIEEHDSLRIATRTALTPVVYGLKYPELVVLIGGTAAIMRPRRRRRLRRLRR
jgi:hypothetical protein